MTRDYDVLIASDFRHSGGTTASIAQEVEVQARMGLRTGLIQIDAPYLTSATWSARIRGVLVAGFAEIVDATAPVTTHILVLRHPRVFESEGWKLAAKADRAVLVANQVPEDGAARGPYYDIAKIRRRLKEELGAEPLWAPIGSPVRDALSVNNGPNLTEDDWCNIINVDAWTVPPRPAATGPLRIGRHSRDNIKKWPEVPEDLLAAYPDSPGVSVSVLGGVASPARILRRKPHHWQAYPFGSIPPHAFLSTLDAYVYFHHSGMKEAFGRAILEALASGLHVITHPYLEPTFGDACIYGTPKEVPALLGELSQRKSLTNERGVELVRTRYDWSRHADRISKLLPTKHAPTLESRPLPKTRVLFISSNGGGLGHLTRLLSIASRLPDSFEPAFVTMSTGVEAVQKLGYWVDYIPGPKSGELRNSPWLAYLKSRVLNAARILNPIVIVFDGTFAYSGLTDALDELPGIFKVWSRRAMWKPMPEARTRKALRQAQSFDLVVEPGEFAAEVDRGFTSTQHTGVTRVSPVVLLQSDELLTREAARAELGLPMEATTALVNLGAGNINRIDNVIEAVAEVLREHPDVHIVAARSIIASAKLPKAPGRITTIETYPLARLIRAFDFCIVAPGYNSYHELVGYGVPTLFIPNEQTALDDQVLRASWGADAGANLVASGDDIDAVRIALKRLLDPPQRDELRQRCAELVACDGGRQAATLIADCARRHRPPLPEPPSEIPRPAPSTRIRRFVRENRKRFRRWLRGMADAPRLINTERRLVFVSPGALATDAGMNQFRYWKDDSVPAVFVTTPADLKTVRRLDVSVEIVTADLLTRSIGHSDLGTYADSKVHCWRSAYNCRTFAFVGTHDMARVRQALHWSGLTEAEPQ